MGFISKTCAKTHLPVTSSYKDMDLAEVVALYPNGLKVEGIYDGYARVNGINLMLEGYNEKEWNNIKFVLKRSYAGEDYKDLGKSHDELAQGFFMSDEFLDYCKEKGKFKNHAEYKKAFSKYANW